MFEFLKHLKTYTKRIIHDQSGNIGKMITPPKSKSPWEAMTRGSTGGWAKGAEPWGPLLTTVAGAIPGWGPVLAAGMGAAGMAGGKTGFRGTDYGWSNVGSTLAGAGLGYLEGGLGRGVSTGIQGAMAGGTTAGGSSAVGNLFVEGFGKGVGSYGLASPGAQAFMKGYPAGSTPVQGGGYLKDGVIYSASKTAVGSYAAGSEAAIASKLATGIPVAGTGGFVGTSGVGAGAASGLVGGAITGGLVRGAGSGVTSGGGAAGKGVGSMIGPALAIGSGIASMSKQPPTATFGTPMENFEAARMSMAEKYLGEAGATLPRAVREQYLEMVAMPIGELTPTFQNLIKPQLDETVRGINEQFDARDEEIDAQFAQAGGIGSKDYYTAKNEARQFRTQETRRAKLEINANALREQINTKLNALSQGAQIGEFDTKIAMELAGLQGQQDILVASMEQQNYEQFQDIMAKLFSAGLYETFIGNKANEMVMSFA